MTIFVPPAVLQKKDAVFDLPMPPHFGQQFVGANVFRVDAGDEVTSVGEMHGAVIADDIAIHAEGDLTAWKGQLLANVLGIF